MSENNTDKITEQQYLELARSSQEKFSEYEKKNKNLVYQINEIKKNLLSCYALSRKLDEFLDTIETPKPYKDIVEYLIGEIRNDLSKVVWDTEYKDKIENLIEEEEDLEVLNMFIVN